MGNMDIKQTKWEELSISNDFLFGKGHAESQAV
jgi:hypothetical protein